MRKLKVLTKDGNVYRFFFLKKQNLLVVQFPWGVVYPVIGRMEPPKIGQQMLITSFGLSRHDLRVSNLIEPHEYILHTSPVVSIQEE